MRKSLEFVGKALRRFLASGANFAYIYSRVRLNDRCSDADLDPTCDPIARRVDIPLERDALQGQSPFVVNAYLDYTNDDIGTSGRLMYNSFGRRIDQVSGFGLR